MPLASALDSALHHVIGRALGHCIPCGERLESSAQAPHIQFLPAGNSFYPDSANGVGSSHPSCIDPRQEMQTSRRRPRATAIRDPDPLHQTKKNAAAYLGISYQNFRRKFFRSPRPKKYAGGPGC